MAEFTVIELRELLNYDTNELQVFTWQERIRIHKLISSLLSERLTEKLEFDLEMKLKRVLGIIEDENYTAKTIKYYDEAGEIKTI